MIDLDIFPELAISVRQPWAWAIIRAGKDIENRTPHAIKFMTPLCGRRAIHASKGMTRAEYEEAVQFFEALGTFTCPPPAELHRGGIIGSVNVTGVVKQSDSRWFSGPRGLVLFDPKPCEFIPAIGALGYFKWKRNDDVRVDTPILTLSGIERPPDLFTRELFAIGESDAVLDDLDEDGFPR